MFSFELTVRYHCCPYFILLSAVMNLILFLVFLLIHPLQVLPQLSEMTLITVIFECCLVLIHCCGNLPSVTLSQTGINYLTEVPPMQQDCKDILLYLTIQLRSTLSASPQFLECWNYIVHHQAQTRIIFNCSKL